MNAKIFTATAIASLLMASQSQALDVSIGGIDASVSLGGDSVASVSASVGGSGGVNADVTVGGGSVATANASVGGGGGGGGGGGTPGGQPPNTTNNPTATNGVQVTRGTDPRGGSSAFFDQAASVAKGTLVLSRDGKILGTVEQVTRNADGSASILIDVNPAYRARVDQVWLRLSKLNAQDDAVRMNISQSRFLQSVL